MFTWWVVLQLLLYFNSRCRCLSDVGAFFASDMSSDGQFQLGSL